MAHRTFKLFKMLVFYSIHASMSKLLNRLAPLPFFLLLKMNLVVGLF